MDIEDVRLAVYRAFAETGRAPRADELAEQLGAEVPVIAKNLQELARARHLALDGQGQIVMAHPFSAVPLGFSVRLPPGCAEAPAGRLRMNANYYPTEGYHRSAPRPE